MPTLSRQSPDLSAFPDLVVIYLGIRVEELRGVRRVARLGPQIAASVKTKPDGLLLHESIFFGFWPLHVGMRQYWRDFDRPGIVGADDAAPEVVDRLREKYRGYFLLARDVLRQWRHGSNLR